MSSSFIGFIKESVNVPSDQEDKFCSLVYTKRFAKAENYISAGEIPKSIAYVKEGLFRYYYISEKGEEFTKGFFTENTVLSSYSATLENRASYFTIQALEASIIEIVNYNQFDQLFKEHPCWNVFLLTLLKKAFIVKEAREREFLLFDATQRYYSFRKMFPKLENRVSQHIIASYLGITPESLSRIRKKSGLLT